jgi:hypothetical protein
MKQLLMALCLFAATVAVAQEEAEENPEKGKFQRNRMFVGTSLNLGFGGSFFQVAATPELGYSITNWLDAGIAMNVNYTSLRYNSFSDRTLAIGPGAFVRVWPVNFLFLTAQPEWNFINLSRKYTTGGIPTEKYNYNASSVLVGGGYGTRIVGQAYSYLAILFDATQHKDSPYRDADNRAVPVFRAGFSFYFNKPKSVIDEPAVRQPMRRF